MAGASKELYESITVNPFDLNKMSDKILQAINMPKKNKSNEIEACKKDYVDIQLIIGQTIL